MRRVCVLVQGGSVLELEDPVTETKKRQDQWQEDSTNFLLPSMTVTQQDSDPGIEEHDNETDTVNTYKRGTLYSR